MIFLANMGVPMIAHYWPAAWLALAPVVAVEAWCATRKLGLRWPRAVGSTLLANLVTTFIGIPLAWFIWALLGSFCFGKAIGIDTAAEKLYAVTVQAGWLVPYESHLWWMIPAAAVSLTVVFYVLSVVIERPIVRALNRDVDRSQSWRWAWQAHLLSYAVVLLFVLILAVVPFRWDHPLRAGPNLLIDWVYQLARWIHGRG